MGAIISAIWRSMSSGPLECKVVIIGLSNAGKTTILYRLNLGIVVVTKPTIGSNVEEVNHKNLRIQAWDVGGGDSMRGTWVSYFQDVDGIIFVIDSSDYGSLGAAKSELVKTLQLSELEGVPILIYANKQDVRGTRTAAQISESMNLGSLKNHSWHIQASCATSGIGLREGLDWLGSRIKERQSVSSAIRSIFYLGG